VRDLPWRGVRDPYAVLVSEVMLQQTQAARVAPRWRAWMARWPTAASLAAASPADVLREWVGLGYNRRALRLREACVVVARDGWPGDLTTLPGVGPYTAAAVGAFAFGRDEAAVDTNVRRVCARLERAPGALLPAGRAAAFNQAMMNLGATVCRARVPRCAECPVARWCPSRERADAAGPRPGRERGAPFRETSRWARGRVVASLAAGEGLPADVPAERLQTALAALERDGLVVRDAEGIFHLPDFRSLV
jgi:A/G-specific adenine glycosylase